MSPGRRRSGIRRAVPLLPLVLGIGKGMEAEAEAMAAAVEEPGREWVLEEWVDGAWVHRGVGRGPDERRAWLGFRGGAGS